MSKAIKIFVLIVAALIVMTNAEEEFSCIQKLTELINFLTPRLQKFTSVAANMCALKLFVLLIAALFVSNNAQMTFSCVREVAVLISHLCKGQFKHYTGVEHMWACCYKPCKYSHLMNKFCPDQMNA
ncbi:unnamed protein product [Caenorhabditis sp. 36 PRJEB53466]|nr:unnamed protein product [Caenorhabditis sp. 36 PRJEB53466]